MSDLLADGTIAGDVTYTHDPLDRRIGRKVDDGQATTTQSFVYDGQDVLLDFVDGDLSSRYTHGPAVDQVLAREVHDPTVPTSQPELLYHLHDHLGSTRSVTDAAGSVVNTIELDAFDNVTA